MFCLQNCSDCYFEFMIWVTGMELVLVLILFSVNFGMIINLGINGMNDIGSLFLQSIFQKI